jgi:hypothetical protein
MEHDHDDIKTLTERWLAGETSLAEEEALRDFFSGAQRDTPLAQMFSQSATAAGERPSRRLILHSEGSTIRPMRRPVLRVVTRRWIATAAAAVVAAVALFVALPDHDPDHDPGHDPTGGIVCMVNGVRITDPDQIALYTREALEIASDNLRRPSEKISSTLSGDPAMARVGEMLNQLTNTDKK